MICLSVSVLLGGPQMGKTKGVHELKKGFSGMYILYLYFNSSSQKVSVQFKTTEFGHVILFLCMQLDFLSKLILYQQ